MNKKQKRDLNVRFNGRVTTLDRDTVQYWVHAGDTLTITKKSGGRLILEGVDAVWTSKA